MLGVEAVLGTFGGIGLFLLGMTVMTQGLEALARRALRRALTRFTFSTIWRGSPRVLGRSNEPTRRSTRRAWRGWRRCSTERSDEA